MNLPDNSARCVTTLSNKEVTYDKYVWEKKRVGMVTTSMESYRDIKTLIRQACSELKCVVDRENKRLIIQLDK